MKDDRSVFLYLRVSTNQQSGGLASQLNSLQNYCRQQGILDYRIFQDEGVSGAKCSRPALDMMMKEIEAEKCRMLIVFSFSRFSRSCTHLLQSLEFLRKHKTEFISISEQINTQSAVGQALVAVLGALAQLERDLIRERVVSGLQRARQAGKHIGRVKTRPSQLIRALRSSGLSLREIARIAKTSHGSVSLELKEWKKEAKEKGVSLESLVDYHHHVKSNQKTASNLTVPTPPKISEETSEPQRAGPEITLPSDESLPKIELEIMKSA